MSLFFQTKTQPPGCSMTPCKTKLGQFVRDQRLARGWTQERLARIAGVKQNTLRGLEVGARANYRVTYLKHLAKALECELSELWALIPNVSAPPPTERGRFIRGRREKLYLSLEGLASKMRVSLYVVRHLEMCPKERLTSVQYIPVLARVLQVSAKSLLPFFQGSKRPPVGGLGALIQERRMLLGMSQSDIADRIGVSRTFVSKIELGRVGLVEATADATLKKLAKALQLDPDTLRQVRPKRKIANKPRTEGTLSALLTARRVELGLSQATIATRAGVAKSTVSDIERNGGSLDSLIKVANALDLDLDVKPKK